MQQTEITALRSFVTVVETGGFSRAAELLDSTTAAVSRRVAALERRLGTRLLNRTTRTMSLTEAGERYYRDLVDILRALEEADARAAGETADPTGTLRITAPLSFGIRRLGPMLSAFMQRHPQLRIVLLLDDGYRDIVSEGLDLAIRIGELKESTLVARRLASVRRYFYASADYLAQHGVPQTPGDLTHHACLHYNNIMPREEWTLTGPDGPETVAVSGPLSANNGDVLRDAAIRGQGIVLLPDFLAEDALAEGRLERILVDYEPADYGLYAVWASRHFLPSKIRLLVDFLLESFGA
ncbi:MAG: LysR family transcriptional regulator [Pseudomonadota bacterium]